MRCAPGAGGSSICGKLTAPVEATAADLEIEPDDLRDLADAAPDLVYDAADDLIRRAD